MLDPYTWRRTRKYEKAKKVEGPRWRGHFVTKRRSFNRARQAGPGIECITVEGAAAHGATRTAGDALSRSSFIKKSHWVAFISQREDFYLEELFNCEFLPASGRFPSCAPPAIPYEMPH